MQRPLLWAASQANAHKAPTLVVLIRQQKHTARRAVRLGCSFKTGHGHRVCMHNPAGNADPQAVHSVNRPLPNSQLLAVCANPLQLAAGRVAAVQAMQQELAQAAAAAFPAEANTYK